MRASITRLKSCRAGRGADGLSYQTVALTLGAISQGASESGRSATPLANATETQPQVAAPA